MNDAPRLIDEYDLAAFLAGTLEERRRQEVVAYLASNPEARELLCMAHEALDVSQQPTSPTTRPTPAPARTPQRATSPRWRLPVARYMAAAVVIFSLGFGARLAFGPADDALRSQQEVTQAQLVVQVETPDLAFAWTPISTAYQYTLVVWDAQEARVVAQHQTRTNSIPKESAFIQDLRPLLEANHEYTLRVDAIDARNRLMISSDLTTFSL